MYADNFYYLGLIVLFPLIGALITGLLGSRLPSKLVDWVACGSVLLSFFLSIGSFIILKNGSSEYLTYTAYKWIYAGNLHVDLSFLLDPLSAMMLLVITGVGFLIHVYSTSYMAEDEGKWKYFSYLNLFVFSMLLLVLGKNMLVTFIGWEGVGACSYLLIGFWYTDEAKAIAGQKAFIINRVGDFGFLIGMFIIYSAAGTLDYVELHQMATSISTVALIAPVAPVAILFIFLGCTGKSAQIPLYTWLPDAMAGPTPVSALIHAATMVTAGVYLLARLNAIVTLHYAPMYVIAVVGVLTALVAASIAIVQTDIKKVLAYSTVSQLGFMFIAIGVGAFTAAIFHLMTHAFFKALLFLGSGSVIHAMGGEQDIRKMGGLKKWMPITRWTFLIGCVAIAGVPLLSGFFSKDMILWGVIANVHLHQVEGVLAAGPSTEFLTVMLAPALAAGGDLAVSGVHWWIHSLVFGFALISAGLTAFYMFRLYFLTFEGECRAPDEVQAHLHESPPAITAPLGVLAALSVIGGWTGWPHAWVSEGWKNIKQPSFLFDGVGAENLYEFLHGFEYFFVDVFHTSNTFRIANRYGESELKMEWFAIGTGTLAAAVGITVAYFLYIRYPDWPQRIALIARKPYLVLESKYKVDEFYDVVFVRGTLVLSRAQYAFDHYIVDGLLVNGVGYLARSLGSALRYLQSGNVQRYATYITLAVVLAVWALLFS